MAKAKSELSPESRQRLRELAGNGVPSREIAALLRVDFKVDITAEALDRDFADDILAGRALKIEAVSKQMQASAAAGSPGAQKAWLDQIREANSIAGGSGESGRGRLKLIRLVVEDVEYQKQRRARFARKNARKGAKSKAEETTESETTEIEESEGWEAIDFCGEEELEVEAESCGTDDSDS